MISIIIAAYNAEKYIEQCIESVLAQSYTDLEVLVVNDGSTDHTLEIVERFRQRDKRIVIINQTNQGPASARNAAMKKMTGEYFTVLDADDWIDSECYKQAYIAAEQYKADMVIWGLQRFTDVRMIPQKDTMLKRGLYNREECRELWLDFIYREGHRINPFMPCRLIRSSVVKMNGLEFDPMLKRSEDYMLLSQIHYYCNRIYSMVDQMYLHYRQNSESITHGYVKNYFQMVLKICDSLTAFANRTVSYGEEVQKKIDRMCLYRTLLSIANENQRDVDMLRKREEVASILKHPVVRKAVLRIGLKEGYRLFGKKFLAMKFKLSFLLLIICKEY